MKPGILHITSGDCAGGSLAKAGLPGEVFIWHDVLYDGSRRPGWPDDATLKARICFLDTLTGGGLGRINVLEKLSGQYLKLESAKTYGMNLKPLRKSTKITTKMSSFRSVGLRGSQFFVGLKLDGGRNSIPPHGGLTRRKEDG